MKIGGESTERCLVNGVRNEAQVILLSDVKVRFVPDQIAVRPQEATRSFEKVVYPIADYLEDESERLA